MKKFRFVLWLMVICLLLPGCQDTQSAANDGSLPFEETMGTVASQRIAFRNPGKLRIAYNRNSVGVHYITSVDQLPDQEVFKQYDEEFFKKNALILVQQTTTSGSVQLAIDAILVADGKATVILTQSMPGEYATTDMASWYLWAEVDAGLVLEWELKGAAKSENLDLHTH